MYKEISSLNDIRDRLKYQTNCKTLQFVINDSGLAGFTIKKILNKDYETLRIKSIILADNYLKSLENYDKVDICKKTY
jgi:hypothetical protein